MNLGRENEKQEFKAGLGQLDKGLQSLSAMLNRGSEGTVSGMRRTRWPPVKKNWIKCLTPGIASS